MLVVVDVLITLFHATLVLANLLLWIPRRTRRWHLAIVSITAGSWFALGPALGRGWGYCLLTDWHWQLKRQIGQRELPSSFVTYLFGLVGIDASAWAPTLTAVAFVLVASVSLVLNLREYFARRDSLGR